MRKSALLLAVVVLWACCDSQVEAQVPYVTYYQPVVVYSPVPAPLPVPAPVYRTSYYAPAVVAAPAPAVVTAPAPVVYQPVTRARTRYRPLLGGTVTRYRSFYAPTPVVLGY